jgi:hypothetical protein
MPFRALQYNHDTLTIVGSDLDTLSKLTLPTTASSYFIEEGKFNFSLFGSLTNNSIVGREVIRPFLNDLLRLYKQVPEGQEDKINLSQPLSLLKSRSTHLASLCTDLLNAGLQAQQ